MASMMPSLRACLRHLCAEAGGADALNALKVLERLMLNSSGANVEHHQIRLSNPALFEKLTKFDSAVETLEACGWEFIDLGDSQSSDDVWMGFPFDSDPLNASQVLEEIRSQREEITGVRDDALSTSVPTVASRPSSSSSSGPKQPVAPPAVPRSQAAKPVVQKKNQKLSREEMAAVHERNMALKKSGSTPSLTGTIRRGIINVNSSASKQMKEIRKKQHQAYIHSKGRKRVGTIADFAQADAEEELRIARIGRYAQRDRETNSNYILKGIGERALQYTNEFRATRNLPPLKWHQYLADIGADHSRDMASGKVAFSHVGFKERVAMYPMKSNMAAENLARVGGPDAAKAAVDGWINSPGHCKNLLSRTKWCGIGVVECSSQYMLTQLFG
uniref:SCP domain-containing protein n=1 Tax=Spongospora subterranea TaxID=70186 RepID=A0A0H5QMD3_9EUKA|eukprot:CRZ03163.1 hypothetical protein [Spongospora subterranea]